MVCALLYIIGGNGCLWRFPRHVLTCSAAYFHVCCCLCAVRYVEFNPVAENVVMTTNADHSVQLCDVAAGTDTAALTIDVHTSSINR